MTSTPKQRREQYKKNRTSILERQKEYYQKNKERMREQKRKWHHKNKDIKPYLKWKNIKANPNKDKFRTSKYRHDEYENRKKNGTVKLVANMTQKELDNVSKKRIGYYSSKAKRKLAIQQIIADSWKKELACFCCGISRLDRAQVEIEHRLPRVALKEKFPYLRLEMKSLTFEEYSSIYVNCPEAYHLKEFKKLTKLEIRRHFALLCRQCNIEVWNYGRCRITDKLRKHKHWRKSSTWLDKTYGLNEYCKTSAEYYAKKAERK
jgi:hypothetical protein